MLQPGCVSPVKDTSRSNTRTVAHGYSIQQANVLLMDPDVRQIDIKLLRTIGTTRIKTMIYMLNTSHHYPFVIQK